MLFVAYWEMDPEHLDDNIATYQKQMAERKEGKLVNHPKPVSDNYVFSGENRGFRIFDAENLTQLENLKFYYHPKMRWTFEPICTAEESITAYLKSKK